MALLSNVPTLSYIRWQNLLIIYKDEVYQIYNNHTNKPFIYFDAINSPNELIMSNKKLEERDGLFYIIFNDNGKYIIVPQTEIEINFSENGSVDAVSSKILGFKEQLNEQSQKVTTIETDVEGVKTTVSQFEESITKNETSISTLEQRANEIDAEVEKITIDFNDDIVIRELRENTTMAILSIQSTLGLFSSDMNTYMKDNKLSSAETDEINAYKENLNNELTLMNLQTNNVIDLLEDKGEVEKVTRLNTAREKLNTAINNLYTNIDTCSVDNVFTNNEIATIISYFGKANVAINELKNLIDECIYLSLGGRLVEEIGKIIVKQDQIQLSVSKNENSIRSTLSKEMSLVQDVVDENIISLNNFRDCLNTISTDGAFTSDEIDVITTRANDLDVNFDEMTSKKSEIEGNTLLSDEQKEEIDKSYTNYKPAHNNLLSNINTITADGLMTTEEMISINEEIENYKNEINNMNTVLCSSLEEINKNGITTDINNVDKKWAEIILDPENGIQSQVGDIQKQINDDGGIIERLNTAEQKITTDAIINTVSSTYYSKEEVDNKLEDIDIGLVVESVDVMYYLSNSATELSGGSWSTTAPTLQNGKYIWSKTVTTFTDDTTKETEPVCITGGKDGQTLYTWIKYSDNEDGSNMYDTPSDNTLYIGIATNKESETESSNPSDYTWSKFRGVDGNSYYTWIRYADDKDGNGISDNPTDKLYIGFAYNKSSNIESNNPSDYMWSLIKGTDGIDGKDGTPYYTWIKYSDNENGSDMYDTPNDNTKYIGIAVNQLNLTESNDPSYYKWSKFKGEDGADGVSAVTYYTWIRYADDEKGSGISDDPTNKNYIGFAYNKTTSTESNNPSDYTWSLIKGKDGVDGTSVKILGTYESESELNTAHPSGNEIGDGYIVQGNLYIWTGTIFENVGQIKGEDGKDGVDGVTLYTWIKYSDNEDGSDMYDTPTDKTKYIGIATNKITQTESNIVSDYKWSKFRGDDGVDGTTYYTWIKYADDENGKNMSNDPTDKLYIGFAYNKTTSTESNVASDYKWSLIKGTDGVDGEKGKDGINYYTWIKYSDNEDGSNMYDIPTDNTKYIGIAVNKTTPTESNVASDYKWSKFRGDDGVDGTDGKGILTVVDYYKVYASDIGVTNATSGFSTDVPQMDATNKYLWSYELITYTDNSTTKTNARVIGVYGEDGTDGKGISSIVEYYAVNNSSETVPTSFETTIPTMNATNRFLWNYEVINFTDGSEKTTDKRIIGVYGETGEEGRGISSIIEQYYLSTSKVSQTDGSWVDSPPTWVEGKYMWTRSKITYSDNSIEYTTPICDNTWENISDLQNQVNNNKTEIETTKTTVATHTTSLNSITSRVETNESNITTVDGKVTNMEKRVSSAEQKITDEAIINTVSSTYATKTDVNESFSEAYSQIEQLADEISSKVSSSDVNSIIRQSPSDIQIGFNGINDRIEINDKYMRFEAENGNRDMLLYGGQVCIYNNTENTFMGTLGHVLRADTSYKGVGFLTGKNCNTFFIGRDSNWNDILTNRSPNPAGVFFINFAKNVDGDIGIHIRDNLYTTNDIQAINNTQPTITGFKNISCTNSMFDNWKSVVDESIIMRYDGAHNIYLGKNLNGNGFIASGFKDITCTNSMFSYWKSITDESTIMRYDGSSKIVLGKNLYGNGYTATGFSTMTASQFTVSNSSSFRIARGELYDPKNGSVYRDYVKLDGTYVKGGTSEICFIRASDADWANIYAGTIYSKQTAVTSDMNLKTDIRYVNIDPQTISESSGLMAPNVNITTEDMHEFIETLPMVSYRMKDDVKNGIDDTYYGFLAQEVLYTKVGSELIKIEETTNEKGETNESYRYSENKFASFIAGALQEEIKERKEEIENLNNTIISLEERIKDLENKLNK